MKVWEVCSKNLGDIVMTSTCRWSKKYATGKKIKKKEHLQYCAYSKNSVSFTELLQTSASLLLGAVSPCGCGI